MKKILIILIIGLFSSAQAQKKNCSIDYEVKNDSVDLIKLNDKLIFEKNFNEKNESLFFSLIRSGEENVLQFQWLEKSKDFTINRCFNADSEIRIDMINADFVNLKIYDNDVCSTLVFDEVQQNNLRILNTFFKIEPQDLEKLLASKMSLLTVNFSTGKEYYNITDKLISENTKTESKPAFFFIEEIPCLKNK